MDRRGAPALSSDGFRFLPACLVAILLVSGCATAPPPKSSPPPDLIVLLPDEEGKSGSIVVSGEGGKQTLTKPRQAVTVAPGSPPGRPFTMDESAVSAAVGSAVRALPVPPLQFILYFELDTTELTKESREKLPEVIRAIRERYPVDASVVGHTDTMGTKDYNHKLSLERAWAVAALLIREGVDPSFLEITSHGEENLLVPTADEVPEPRNRRVEVTVR